MSILGSSCLDKSTLDSADCLPHAGIVPAAITTKFRAASQSEMGLEVAVRSEPSSPVQDHKGSN